MSSQYILPCTAAALPLFVEPLNDTEDQSTVWDTHSMPPGIDFQTFPENDGYYTVPINKRQIAGTVLTDPSG